MMCTLVNFKEQNQAHTPVFYSYLIKIHSFSPAYFSIFAALVILSISILHQTHWLTEVTLLYMTSHVTIPMVTAVLSQTVS